MEKKVNTLLDLHSSIMNVLSENKVPWEVREKVSEVLEEYMTNTRRQANELMLMAQKFM